MIDSRDLTFVVQGPIVKNLFSTADCLLSIRKHFPESPIVLSTYEGSDLFGCSYDTLVLNKDPGSCPSRWRDAAPLPSNINRMIFSSKNGLKAVKTRYSCKTRTDIFFQGNQLLQLNTNYSHRDPHYTFTQERILVSGLYTKNPRIGKHCCFHISDVLLMGLSSDLLSLFDIPLASSETLYNKFNETYLWHSFIRKKTSSSFKDCLNVDTASLDLHDKFLANNVIVYEPAHFDVVFPFPKKSFRSQLLHQWTIYTHQDWRYLYELYSCGNRAMRSIYNYWSVHHYLYKFCDALMDPKRWPTIIKKRLYRT